MSSIIRVGPAGWSYRDWEGTVYPAPRPRGFEPLEFLAQYFDTIEINSSFYAPCRPDAAKKWAERVGHNKVFRFTAKLWRRFTHERLGLASSDIVEWRRGIDPLGEAGLVGAVLVQFPWSFKNGDEERRYLVDILTQFRDYPLVVEVRHRSWNQEAFFEFLHHQRVGFCNIDQPVIGDSIPLTGHLTSAIGYWRLHGRNYKTWFQEDAGRDARYNYLYTAAELDEVAGMVRNITGEAQEIYVVTNNHFQGQAVVNAEQLQQKLGLRANAPFQRELFEKDKG